MTAHGQNFMRLWSWEQSRWAPWTPRDDYFFAPPPYERTGPGTALDGRPKFDVTRFDQGYFDRLRTRVIEARDRGIYVSVMLFNGWSIEVKRPWGVANNPWRGHPFNGANNVNGIDGDLDGDGEGREVHTLANRAVTARQDAYIRRVIDTVGDLDNVLFEIANESSVASVPWQLHMIEEIHRYEATRPAQHPVLFTCAWGHDGRELWSSPAEAISPGWPFDHASFVPYRDDPPYNDGRKIVVNDTDHMWGIGGTRAWVWKSFLRGLNPIYMDAYDEVQDEDSYRVARPTRDEVILAMEHTAVYARRVDLSRMVPRAALCSTTYCLGDPGEAYLVYLPSRMRVVPWLADRLGRLGHAARVIGLTEAVEVDLTAATEPLNEEWLNPRTGQIVPGASIRGGAKRVFTAPFPGDAVLYLRAAGP
jgi:hypothetical protein